jgi:hypothetical protein
VLVLKLIGHVIGSAAVYGVLVMTGFLFLLAASLAWAKLTGDQDAIYHGAKRWRLAILPGIVVLLWYPALAAHLVLSAGGDTVSHAVALLCIGGMATLGDLVHRRSSRIYAWPGFSVLLGAAGVISYVFLIDSPLVAAALGKAWSKAVEAAIIALLTQ